MKKIFIYSTLFAVAGLFASCDEDQDYSEMRPSIEIGADVSSVTVFDTEFTVNFTASNTNITSIDVKGGSFEETVTLSDKKGSINLNENHFGGAWEVGESTDFMITSNFGSYKSESGFSISVVDATGAESSSETISEYDSTKVTLSSMAESMYKNIGNIKVEKAIRNADNPNPVFAVLKEESNKMKLEHETVIYGADLAMGDTVVYKLTATSGDHTEMKMVEVPVVTKSLPDEMKGMLSVSSPDFAFMPSTEAGMDDKGVISFVDPRGVTSTEVMFVKIEEGNQVEDFNELLSFSTLVSVIEAETLTNSIASVTKSDVYAFKYTYMYWDYYGFMTIEDIHSASIGDQENAISFVYRQDKKQ